ncbi:uncharacterized protein LOC142332847 isoform X2 [Lycorma delicatula]
MSKYFTIVLVTFIYIFNEVSAEYRCPFEMSKKDCLNNLFNRTSYFTKEEMTKVVNAIETSRYSSGHEIQKNIIQIFDIHNWKSGNYVNLFLSLPNISLEQLISIVHYGDGKWWAPLFDPSFSQTFGIIELVEDITHGFKNMIPMKKWLEEFIIWTKRSTTNKCNYEQVKPIFSIFRYFETKRNLSNEILKDIHHESELPENSSHVIFNYYCNELNLKQDENQRKQLFENFSLIINERLIDLLNNPYCSWNLNDALNFMVDSVQDSEIVTKKAFREDLIKIAITINFNKERFQSYTNNIKSEFDLVEVSEALNLIVPYIKGECTESDLTNLLKIIIENFRKYPNNPEDVTDIIKIKLKDKKFSPNQLILELNK